MEKEDELDNIFSEENISFVDADYETIRDVDFKKETITQFDF